MSDVCWFVEQTGNNARKNISYPLKQIISREVESERMRRSERIMMGRSEEQEVRSVCPTHATSRFHDEVLLKKN